MGKDLRLGIVIDQSGNAQAGLASLASTLSTGIAGAAAIGVAALAGITGAVVGIGAAAINAWSSFDAGEDKIASMTGASGAVLEGMSESMLDISESAAGVGQSMEGIGATIAAVGQRTGATGEALETLSAKMLALSRVTGDDAVQSTEQITRVMGDWGVSMEDSSALVDKLLTVSQKTGIGVDSLSEKLVQFGAPLRAMGFSLDESAALFGKWEKEGVNAELVMGSLRIAAGHFATEQEKLNTVQVGGVKSMAQANEKLIRLKENLRLANLKQSEFTSTTKESTRVQSQQKIAEITKQIEELSGAMAKGEIHTEKSAAANKSLKESLLDTFTAIKGATSDTEALGIAMEIFGARAGPDMAAAIREGRFSIDDLVASIGNSEGALDSAAEATLDFGDRFGLLKQKVMNSLIPVGQQIMDIGDKFMPTMQAAADTLIGFITNNVVPGIDALTAAFDEGGLAGVFSLVETKIAEALPKILEQLGVWGTEFWGWITEAGGVVEQADTKIGEGITAISTKLADSWPVISEKIETWKTDFWMWITGPGGVIETAPGKLTEATDKIGTAIKDGWPTVKTNLETWGTEFWDWLMGPGGALERTNGALGNLTTSINAWVNGDGQTKLTALGNSMGVVMVDSLGLAIGGKDSGEKIASSITTMLVNAVFSISDIILKVGTNISTGIVSGILGKFTGGGTSPLITDTIRQVLTRVALGLNPLLYFTPTGRAVIDGMVRGVGAGVDRLKEAVMNAARRAYEAAMRWLGANSPSTKFIDMGENVIMEGAALGVEKGSGRVGDAIGGAFSGLAGPSLAGAFQSLPVSPKAQFGGAAGGGVIIVNLAYSPIISMADKAEAQNVLAPFIAEGIRRQQQGTRG